MPKCPLGKILWDIVKNNISNCFLNNCWAIQIIFIVFNLTVVNKFRRKFSNLNKNIKSIEAVPTPLVQKKEGPTKPRLICASSGL